MEERTFVEILRERMGMPVKVKGADATVMPMEAMVMSVMNNAMKGDIGAILFIRNLKDNREDSVDLEEQRKVLAQTVEELSDELKRERLDVGKSAELELLAVQLITLRRIASTMAGSGHKDIQVMPQKDGSERRELSTTNRIFNDLYKAWRKDWSEYRNGLLRAKMRK